VPGAPAADAPVAIGGRTGWLLGQLGGTFDLLLFDADQGLVGELSSALGNAVRISVITSKARRNDSRVLHDVEGLAARRYDGHAGSAYLLRPDQHIAARWRVPSLDDVRAALTRAQGNEN